jgi:CRP-like cAMP-binding protein
MLPAKHAKVNTSLQVIDVEENMILFEKDEIDDTAYFLIDGAVKLYVQKNDEEHDLGHVKRNEFFGDHEIYSHAPRTVCARTLSPSKIIAFRTEVELEQFISENRWLSGKIMEDMSKKLAETNKAIVAKKAADTSTNVVLEVQEKKTDTGASTRRVVRH